VVTSRIDGHLYAVVSVNAFEGVAPSRLQRRRRPSREKPKRRAWRGAS
jgi:hypothetical protein